MHSINLKFQDEPKLYVIKVA